jgi:hypothetical protein
MKATKLAAILAVVLVALGVQAPAAHDDAPGVVEGEVVRLMQQTSNQGELDALQIRTRQGESMQLLLGEAGSSAGRVQEGDRIRARLSNAEPDGEAYRVRSMKVRRTGERLQYRDAAGEMLQTQARDRFRDGTGTATQRRIHNRDRIHEPGTGGGTGGHGHRGGGKR